MNEAIAREVARQLRKPEGEGGIMTGKKMNEGNIHINRNTIQIVGPAENDHILEIGMGNGFFVSEIVSAHPSLKYTGIDFSELMIEEAGKINEKWVKNGQVDFILAAAENTPFTPGSFNKVFTVNTIYFWENERKVLEELIRILKPGGKLIIALRPKHQMKDYPFTKYGFTMFSMEDLDLLLTSSGLCDVRFFENEEPPFEMHGEIHKMQNLIVSAVKN
jgi:ubiquinone/menaquinone biosynthesis C-methylase UbiE